MSERREQGFRRDGGRTIELSVRGLVGDDLPDHARRRLQPLVDRITEPVHHATVHVVVTTAPGRHRASEATIEVALDHDVLRAHAAGPGPAEAVDHLHDRFAAQVEHHRSRRRAVRRRPAASPEGEWRHGDGRPAAGTAPDDDVSWIAPPPPD